MGTPESSAASIGFFGDDLDPLEITRQLGCEPTVGVAKGGTWITATGAEKVARTGSWRLKAERRAPADLDAQIGLLLSAMNDDLEAWQSLAGRCRGRVFCGVFLASGNDGLTLRPETLLMIGQRSLVLDLDIYEQTDPD
jgi:hypothetical protein